MYNDVWGCAEILPMCLPICWSLRVPSVKHTVKLFLYWPQDTLTSNDIAWIFEIERKFTVISKSILLYTYWEKKNPDNLQ